MYSPIITDRNVVGLLLFILTEGEVISSDMVKINRNYSMIKPVAVELRNAGLIESRSCSDHRTKRIWTITDEGKMIAELLYEAEMQLRKTSISEKYYKW